jgi:hypothetical protein
VRFLYFLASFMLAKAALIHDIQFSICEQYGFYTFIQALERL